MDFESPEYEDFYRWVFSPRTVLNSRFAASAFVFERGSGGRYPDVSDRILQFWAGARVPATELRSWLKELGEVAAYKFEKVSELELSIQRYEFLSRLIRATGYAGWVILVDEVELMGRYSILQRAKSYAEMTRLLGLSDEDRTPGLSVSKETPLYGPSKVYAAAVQAASCQLLWSRDFYRENRNGKLPLGFAIARETEAEEHPRALFWPDTVLQQESLCPSGI